MSTPPTGRSPSPPTQLHPLPDLKRGAGGNLPSPLTSLVGRESEIAAACTLLQRDDVRLLTLTGPGGVGKTRLALAIADELSVAFPDGVWHVSLAPIRDPDFVAPAIAQALGLQEESNKSTTERLAAFLHDHDVLLLLDNFEQVIEASPLVPELLSACPNLTVLVTSRVRLRVSGEHERVVPPLAVPEVDQTPTVEEALQSEAVRLFVARAEAAEEAFVLTSENAPTVAAICRRLDGLPLAIELAAARLKVLPPSALLARLEQRLPLLTGGARDAPARLQSMRDAIAWSYDLLTSDEQALFRRLGVFVGSFSLEAVAPVASAAGDLDIDVFDGITTLADASLLRQAPGPVDDPRHMMLETIREFALERLAASDEEMSTLAAHAAWYLSLAENAFQEMIIATNSKQWLPRFDAELDNFRAALTWFAANGEPAVGLQLTSAMFWFWPARGLFREGKSWLDRFLGEGLDAPPNVRARSLAFASTMAYWLGDFGPAEARAAEALALARQLDDANLLCWALASAGAVAAEIHQDYASATSYFEEKLAVGRAAGLTWDVHITLHCLGILAYGQGNFARARTFSEEAVALSRAAGGWLELGNSVGALALVVLRQGDYAHAARLLTEVLALNQELVPDTVNEVFALLAAECGQAERAARLYGANDSWAKRYGVDPFGSVAYHSTHERAIAAIREDLGENVFEAAWSAGAALPPASAIAEADALLAAVLEGAEPSLSKAPASPGGLSPRELEVVRLIAAGRSNLEIADALYISHGTATTHVRNILSKLDLDSRTAVAAWAIHQGLD